ncbi:nicotinate (nicotinamide) nucleotide adenylyltransferase [Occallatibacter savannae]|uniref:nicotinate (nicotinamide) nucleotide adenylyltransferase n=1 Tax=Occallatibacter savannae TaxID=1002691 RepID=UPI000D689925|nr:nicotinate (nicotinamide) nucleotide adenylyltransferase [Occallatibacter savannae]
MHPPASEPRRIAFFGGSFDPPHMGHLGIARAAQALLQLDTVLFTPVGSQPLKPLGSTASFEDRVAMTELAISSLPNFAVSFADAPDPSGEPNYSIDTLHRLQAQFPSAQLFTLMGADSFLSLRRWYRGADIPFLAPLIVASRPGQELHHLSSELPDGLSIAADPQAAANRPGTLEVYLIRNTSGAEAPLYLLPGLEIEISASEIRQNVSAALDRLCAEHSILPAAVCDYISTHHLYQLA